MTRRHAFWLLFLALLWPPLGRGQQDNPCLHRQILVAAENRDGGAVPPLSTGNFRVSLNRQPIQILSAVQDSGARRIVLLVDLSSSMVDHKEKWGQALATAEAVVGAARQDDSVALLTFAETVEEKMDFPSGHEAVLAKLRMLRKERESLSESERSTSLADAILQALSLLQPTRPGDAVFVISDGGENKSRANLASVRDALQAHRVRLFSVVVIDGLPWGEDADEREEEWRGAARLEELAQSSGGWRILLVGRILSGVEMFPKEEVSSAMESVRNALAEIQAPYRLEVELPASPAKATKWSLTLADSGDKAYKHLELHYPDRILPCSAP